VNNTDDNDNPRSSGLPALRRYVPLAAWAVAILTILMIPLRIIQYGYLPGDDALRHAAKAVSGRPWPEILVLGPSFHFDPNWGWHWLLREIYLSTHWNTEGLVLFEVIALFVVAGWAAMLCLKRPEAWLAAMVLISLVSDFLPRLLLGRPFVLTITAVAVIFLAWQRHGPAPPKWWTVLWMTPLITLAVFLHGVWYLWTLPIAAFFLAGQFRWCFMLAGSWIAATFFGSALTGHPVESILQALQVAFRAVGLHETQNTLVSELQPSGGDIYTIILIGGLLIARQLLKLDAPPLHRNPAFWLVVMCWVLGCETSRFWEDWGLPALMVLMTCDLQMIFQARFALESFKRLGLVCGLALAAYAVTTSDVGSRWTHNLTQQYLSVAEHPELEGWMPDNGGIFYSAEQSLFYQTFFKNPDGDWRYVLGFESSLMTDEDFAVYQSVRWNDGDAKAYKPWVDKMRPQDRLVILGGRGDQPNIPQLEWNYGVSGIWIGRLPRTNSPPVAPKISATAAH
jgi:hypothetical protein